MRRLALVSWLALALAGCGDRTQIAVTQICASVCECVTVSPLEEASCVDECEAEAPAVLPEACLDCAFIQACGDLSDCLDTCDDVPEEF